MAARAVLNGRYAEASIGGTLLALLFDWSVEVHTDHHPAEGYGDVWKYPIPVVSGWTCVAKGYVVPNFPPQYIKSLWKAGGQQLYFDFVGYASTVAVNNQIWAGKALPLKGRFTVPMAFIEQDIELSGYGPPTVGLTA